MYTFPQNFLWGAATSSYQVEGNNIHADWWHWEKAAGKEESADACRHYELYSQDFDRAKSLHHNAHRFSLEWSRIEPEEGKFDLGAIAHYKEVIAALRQRGLEPLVTLHHFTNPLWLSEKGGWLKSFSVDYFVRFCEVVVKELAPSVRYWMTINEPTIYASHSFLFGAWPPQGRSWRQMMRAYDHMVSAHLRAYQCIHKIYKEAQLPAPCVGLAHHMSTIETHTRNPLHHIEVFFRNQYFNFDILDKAQDNRAMDFIGINYYSRQIVGPNRHPTAKKNSLGWEIFPRGIYQLLIQLKKYRLPIMVTENGICTTDDNFRWEFIQEHLISIHQAIQEGAPVMGYMYWSLLDNFEWDKGFAPRFGLIDVNYANGARTIRNSAWKYGEVCRSGIL